MFRTADVAAIITCGITSASAQTNVLAARGVVEMRKQIAELNADATHRAQVDAAVENLR